jgi:secreted PhoX family phosphatase
VSRSFDDESARNGRGNEAHVASAAVRLNRRAVLRGAAGLAAVLALRRAGALTPGASVPLEGALADRIALAPGFSHDVVIRWGDPLFPGVPGLDSAAVARDGLLAMSPQVAAGQFGYNNDAVHFFPLDAGGSRGIVCVNHEFTNEELFLPGLERIEKADPSQIADYVRRHPQIVPLTQAMHGVSVTVIERDRQGRWRHSPGSRVARRVTAQTPCLLTGPARGHPLLRTAADPSGTTVLGTLNNCAGGQTPWGTFLTAEENVDHYFGNGGVVGSLDPVLQEAHRRLPPRRAGIHGWEFVESRFDLGHEPRELLRFGWIVEIDPHDPHSPPRKRTALGRFKHECAATALTRDGRLAVYSGDDDRFEYLYKFVTRDRVHPRDRAENRDLLDHGTLLVARFDADGSGRWLPLVHGQGPLTDRHGFASQADVVLRARAAADLLGATPMDRPEDVAPDAATGRVYVALTGNEHRRANSTSGRYNGREIDLGPDAVNPVGPNVFGHVVEIEEHGADCGALEFGWRIFVTGGPEQAEGAFGSPDNLDLDADGNLWIVTDGAQPGGLNNGCHVVPTRGPERGRTRQVMSAPLGSEVCGCKFVPDGKTLLLAIQHPGEGGSLAQPRSSWPDGPGHVPRPSLVALHLP